MEKENKFIGLNLVANQTAVSVKPEHFGDFKIDDDSHELLYVTEDGTEVVVNAFLKEAELMKQEYTLYAYVELAANGTEFYVKFGEAVDETVYERYHHTGMTQNRRMIAVWASSIGDKAIHAILKKSGSKLRGYEYNHDYAKLGTTESYRVYNREGLANLLADISVLAKGQQVTARRFRKDFPDVEALVQELLGTNKKYVIADLCPRWGKTGTFTLLYKHLATDKNIRFHVIGSYVGTVEHSYSEEINTLKNNENCLFITADEVPAGLSEADFNKAVSEQASRVRKWIAADGHYVVYYLPLTGDEDSCFKRRINLIKQVKDLTMTMLIEEADFGAGCEKQIKKIKSLVDKDDYNFKHLYITTGTNAAKWDGIFDEVLYVKRDYILDVLGKRTDEAGNSLAVGINWKVLNNKNMVEKFGYSPAEMENWTALFELDDSGHFKNEQYIKQALSYVLRNEPGVVLPRQFRELLKQPLINSNAANMLFTAPGNDIHKALKELIEVYFQEYTVVVLDGNYTTNAEAEVAVKKIVKAHYEKYNNYNVVVISSEMGSRSFSVKEIKNIILMCNALNSQQKIARGLTYWAEHPEIQCAVVDFSLSAGSSNLANYLVTIAKDTLSDTATHRSLGEVYKTISATDKLVFTEYWASGENPIKPITPAEIKERMQSNDSYKRERALAIFKRCITEVDLPEDSFDIPHEELDLSELVNSNYKGDATRTVRKPTPRKDPDKSEVDPRQYYLNYLLNHKMEFNSRLYKTDILKNEFMNNMPEKRKAALEAVLNIDMTVICQIARVLIRHDVDIY